MSDPNDEKKTTGSKPAELPFALEPPNAETEPGASGGPGAEDSAKQAESKTSQAEKHQDLAKKLQKMKELAQLGATDEIPFGDESAGFGMESDATESEIDPELLELRKLLMASPEQTQSLCIKLYEQRKLVQKRLVRTSAKLAKAEKALAEVKTPPLHPASVLRLDPLGRVEVLCDGRRLLVTVDPDVDVTAIEPHDEVFLDSDGGTIVARSDVVRRTGGVGTVSEVLPDGALVRGVGDEETAMTVSPGVDLKIGDRVVYARDYPHVVSKLEKRDQSAFVLDSVPRETFDDIGGLDAVVSDIRRDLDLHLKHPEIAKRHGLSLLRGITLVGVPGVGKTLLAKAIASYIASDAGQGADTARPAHFMHIKPGALRGIYYGLAEERIRGLFTAARNAPGLVVMFFDEIDTYGARGVGIGQDIDGRVLGALLAEIDGLEAASDLLCIGATNRLELCDGALVRAGRLGDRIYEIPRPAREATREILSRYLAPELPLAGSGAELAEAATSYLHTERGGAGRLAIVTMRNGDQREVRAGDVVSGAMLAGAVQRARHAAAHRDVEAAAAGAAGAAGASATSGPGLEDLLAALDDALDAEARKIADPQLARQALQIANGQEIVRVEVAREPGVPAHRYVRAA